MTGRETKAQPKSDSSEADAKPPPDKQKTSEESEAGPKIEHPGSGTDIPTWVNGSYLSCAWQEVTSETDAAVACSVKSTQAGQMPSGITIDWSIQELSGQAVQDESLQASTTRLQVSMAAKLYATRVVHASLHYLDDARSLEESFETLLPGLSAGGTFQDCLMTRASIKTCFQENSIALSADTPNGDSASEEEPPISAPDDNFQVNISINAGSGPSNYSAGIASKKNELELIAKVIYTIQNPSGSPKLVTVSAPAENFRTPSYELTGSGLLTISAVVYFKDKRTPIKLPDSKMTFL